MYKNNNILFWCVIFLFSDQSAFCTSWGPEICGARSFDREIDFCRMSSVESVEMQASVCSADELHGSSESEIDRYLQVNKVQRRKKEKLFVISLLQFWSAQCRKAWSDQQSYLWAMRKPPGGRGVGSVSFWLIEQKVNRVWWSKNIPKQSMQRRVWSLSHQ